MGTLAVAPDPLVPEQHVDGVAGVALEEVHWAHDGRQELLIVFRLLQSLSGGPGTCRPMTMWWARKKAHSRRGAASDGPAAGVEEDSGHDPKPCTRSLRECVHTVGTTGEAQKQNVRKMPGMGSW